MSRFFTFLRIIPLIIFCLVAATAVVRVQVQETANANQPQLPTRIGETRRSSSFPAKVSEEMSKMWMEFYVAYLPGLIPGPVAYSQKDPHSLSALKSRTKSPQLDQLYTPAYSN